MAEGDRPEAECSDASPIIVAHFQSVRDDIQKWVERRDRYAVLTAIACGAVGYFAISIQDDTLFLLLIPALIFVSARMIFHAELLIGAMVQFLRTEYEDDLEATYGRKITHWDSSEAAKAFARESSFFNRNAAIGLIYFVGCWAAGGYRLYTVVGQDLDGVTLGGLAELSPSAMGAVSLVLILHAIEAAIYFLAPISAYWTIRSAVRTRAKSFEDDAD
jgi:hypothetical protein